MELFEGNGFACSSATTDSSSQSSVAEPPVKKQDLSSLIVHTFLPRKIPDCFQEDLSSIEEWMLKYVHDAISAILATGVMPELESTRLMFEKWMLLQPKSVDGRAQFTEEFQESVRNLQIGDTISLYIRKQNSTIMIIKTEEEKFQVMTFRSSLSCETVMSTVGSLVMDFPETKDVILNADILASKMFASHLHELSTEVFELSMPQTKKGGHDYSELREVADPLLVSDWIVGLLLPTSSEETEHDKCKITKKIRDEVNLETSSFAIPFRRSGMWMAVKVALQLQIENLMGDTKMAKMVYKSIVLWTLAAICDGHHNEEIDMSSQMLAKIGRRVKKLQDLELQLVKEHLMSIEESLEIHHACLEFVASVVDNVSKHMNTVWMEMSSPDVNRMVTSTFIPPIVLSEDEIDNGLQHHIPLLDNYVSRLGTTDRWINDTVKKVFLQNPTEDMAKSLNLKRYATLQDILTSEVNFLRSTAHQKRIWFYDTENFIKNHLHDCSSESILKLIFVYVRRASPAYRNGTNPVGFSQMLLCVLKSVQVLDEIATNAYPLLKKYKSGINSVEFDKLLLPHKKDMKLLDELLDYFKSRDLEARWPSIISEREVKLQTFAVLYAKSNKEMQQLRSRILTDIKKGIAEKYEEVDRVRTDCQILQSRIIAVGACKCECEIEIYGGPTKTLTCTSCNLTSLLQYKRHSVAVYERPLPPSEICQQAVVFELKLPSKLAELRDALAFLNFEILSLPPFDGPSDCLLNWLDYSSVRNYEPTCKPGQVVNLCSDELPASQTHHTRIYIPDVLNNVNSEFIVDNGMNYIYDNESKGYATRNVKKSCTFQISSTCNPSWKMFKYLQYTITDTLHCQNRVIADSNNCHRDMTIAEFISFGSIRAGHRIQLRNLYRSISDRTLALEREATTCLVLQTLWQVGPKDEEGNTRESHLDFTNNDLFTQSFLELLEQVVDLNQANYSHPLILLNVVVITIRIMELNESCIQNGVKLLRQCRKVVDDWVQRIGENMVKQCDGSSRGEVHLLKKNLLEATVCSAFSFNMSTMAHLNYVIESQDDLVHWYSTLSRLNELTELETLFSSSFSKTLVKYAFDVALKIEAGIATSHLLHDFARTQWNKANECSLLEESWDCVKEHENLFIGEYVEAQTNTHHLVTFDILLGIFLVDGQPQGVLHGEIEAHELYRRFFNKNKLKIQKDSRSYRTVVPFHGKHYEFIPKSRNRSFPRIKELADNNGPLELLDPAFFIGKLASFFIMNYTHWLNSKENVVYFKPLPSQNTEYNLPSDFILTRNDAVGGTWILQDIRSGFQFLSIKSNEFATICAVLKRIENHELINIIVNPKSRALTVKLPRYNLKFNLVRQNLHSVEYPDFKISRDQHIGTLVGIQQGILLDNGVSSNNLDIFQRRMLIIPHGSIEVQKAAGSLRHQHVEISLDNLQQPPFFSYEFDEELRRLKADKSKAAWLYLAALHATTSSSLPDIFTGVTGTEMAVWILQSALVWSCSPYDKESLAILKHIKDMSPAREYYGTEMRSNEPNMEIEVTYWPTGLPSLTAFDGFTFIVDQLISDSNNLAALFPDMPRSSNTESSPSTQRLQIRAYHRSLSLYNQNVAVKPDFFQDYIKSHVEPAKVEIPQLGLKLHCDQLLEASKGLYCFDKMKFPPSDKKCGLVSYLITSKPLAASDPLKNLHIMSLSELLGFDFRGNWLRLYGHCLSQRKKDAASQIEQFEEKQAWKILLANVRYCDPSHVKQIMNIHYIASNAQHFPEPPSNHYGNPSANDFVGKEVETILMNNSHSFTSWNEYHRKICSLGHSDSSSRRYAYGKQQCCSKHEEEHKKYNEKKSQFELELRKDVEGIITAIKQDWPCKAVQNDKEYLFQSPKLNNEAALAGVNKQLSFWHKNHELLLFVQNVEEKLNMSLSRNFGTDERLKPSESEEFINQFGQLRKITIPIHIVSDQPPTIDLEAHLGVLFRNRDFFADAKQVYSTGCIDNSGQGVNWNEVESCAKLIANLKDLIDTKLQDNISKRIIFQTGICPRTNPLSLLPYLMKDEHDTRSQLEWITGALAVLWSHVKRHKRSITLNSKGEAISVELKREWENKGYQNWSPAEHPDWLLLELELDLMIRPVQVDVAMQMMKMPDGKNGVMQLNMGEGKTSLLVPLLCSTLANKTTLCRVTVLQSIFKTNFKILSFAIGGLLNRRVYTFPCRRDMEIGTSCLQSINAAYSDCLNKKGVVLTLPEHRLSFRLKIYDQIVKGNVDLGLKFLKTENWLRKYARDILDESDELLSVKYQLVYTIGTQVPIDGGDLRWKTCQKILKIVMDIANELYEKFGSSVVEYNPIEESPEKFNHFRLINSACRDEFYDSVAEHFLREVKLPSAQKKYVKLFLTSSSIGQKVHSSVMTIFKDNPDLLNKILLVSGYICRGILELALSKRWRVEYGVDPKGQRRMAVPFRAKDVAAERTEFGHPDLAIILTHLSYYYSGLSDDELLECFNCLKAKVGPDMIYSSWIQTIPKEKVPKFLLTYQGVNIRDPYHCSRLFNLFQKNKQVIDFWLSEKVFPRESKQFPGKIVMTAWDLCYERYQHPVCGFAGTNDSSILLPLQISQQDLPVLLDTNRKLENTLLQPNNCNHKGFQMGVSCREILEEMRKDGLQVLIDSGAMMLQCEQNEQVAKLWLEIDSEIEAVVYFSQDNDMLVKCRSENVQSKVQDLPLELSPYRNSLGKCGVFLDDQHSRGTDLKFPTGFKACVTVGTRMRRDKMAQACMRMRKLAEGDHSITFYLSNEAYDKVMKLKGSDDDCETSELSSRTLETQDVISWVCQNTKEFNADGMLYWTLAGKNYAQKLSAEDSFHYPEHSSPTFDLNNSSVAQAAEILGSKCVDDEVLLLTDMYGIFTESALLVNLIPGWFAFTKDKLTSKNLGKTSVEKVVLETIFSICDRIKQRCLNEVPEKTHVASMLEEEQERELEKEMELEEERHIVRPKRAAETKPSLHPNVTKMVLHGKEVSQTSGISRLSDVFQCTSFWNEVQPDCWGIEVFATNDFISVIKTPNHWSKTDMHLRPMEYLAAGKNKNGSYQLLVLSPFEVNELMPFFRRDETSLKLHMFTMRRFEKQDVLINNPRLQLPLCQPVNLIPDGSRAMAAMLIASGSLYFHSKSEQEAFARYLALVPQPWTDDQTLAFEQGMITNTGFLRANPKYRRQNWELFQVESFSFLKDPISLVKKILRCRHPVVNDVAHVIRLLDDANLVQIVE